MSRIPKSVLSYLKDLRKNNDRDWFNAHKEHYLDEQAHMIAFAESLRDALSHHDQLVPQTGKKTLYRIYRDTRFSKDKTPYKTHFSGSFARATKWLRGGYYFHIEPGKSFLGGGFWGPNSDDLARIRQEIAADAAPMRQLITDPTFVATFGELRGDQLKTAPRGYAKDHPAVDLLRYKQFLLVRDFTDKEVLAANFQKEVVETFRRMRPFFDYMSEVLTTDENGMPLE